MKAKVSMAIALCVAALLSACGTARREVRIEPPQVVDVSTGTAVTIGRITDARDFQTIPGTSGARLTDSARRDIANEKSRVIGGAMQIAWVLPQGDSVQDWIHDLIATGLKRGGFRVIPAGKAAADTPVITARIDEFWTYMPFDLGRSITWTQQMKAWLRTTVTVTVDGKSSEVEVIGEGAHIVHSASDENIREAYGFAADDYLNQFQRKVVPML